MDPPVIYPSFMDEKRLSPTHLQACAANL